MPAPASEDKILFVQQGKKRVRSFKVWDSIVFLAARAVATALADFENITVTAKNWTRF